MIIVFRYKDLDVSIHLAAETGLRVLEMLYLLKTTCFNPPCGGDGFKRSNADYISKNRKTVSIHLAAETGLRGQWKQEKS